MCMEHEREQQLERERHTAPIQTEQQETLEQQEQHEPLLVHTEMPLAAQQEQEDNSLAVQQAGSQQIHQNAGHKRQAEADPQQLARRRERRRRQAQRRDDRAASLERFRRNVRIPVRQAVSAWKTVTGQNRAQRRVQENTQYLQSLQMAYDEMYALRLQAQEGGMLEQFYAEYGDYYRTVRDQFLQARHDVQQELGEQAQQDQQAYQQRLNEVLQERQVPMRFGPQQRVRMHNGARPAAVQYAQDGSRWLVKESVSCIGRNDPAAAIVTETGYQIQRLVHPDTAIEAFRGQSVGRGIVSYQCVVNGIKAHDVNLSRFSRTPDAMTQDELQRIEELSPQLLREHTTDWLLCNFGARGENFVISNDGSGPDRVYGIDKDASLRTILDKDAQHMEQSYQHFGQNTVYNRLFQKFADGTMDLDLNSVLPQIQRVEAMDDQEYMGIFRDFLRQKEREFPRQPEKVEQIRQNILARKRNLRMEYRDFFTSLVEQRCKKLNDAEAAALRTRYFGSPEGGTFIFAGEQAADLQAERQRRIQEREGNQEELARRAQEADRRDEKSYKRRHLIYDFSKTIVMGLKKLGSRFRRQREERRTTTVPLSQIRTEGENLDPDFMEQVYAPAMFRLQQEYPDPQALREAMDRTMVELPMVSDHEIFLGGTKPMSEYIGADGSQWLAKQAVNCMGYYKIEGALLTECGAKLQNQIDPATAVDAFVGRTRRHGDVSFQRRLEHVESGPNKLDLFRFSKHPEIATSQTIAAVQALSPQILREHTTDWLLCNFDTKGENFIITIENNARVLHGIDKEAAFNKILAEGAQHMDRNYRPHANDTLYNVIFRMYAENQMDLELNDVVPQIQRISAMTDDAYMATFQSYLDHVQRKDPAHYQVIYDKILCRKTNLREEYRNFFTELINERCKKLHPTEAAALRAQYIRPDGWFFFSDEPNPYQTETNSTQRSQTAASSGAAGAPDTAEDA